MKKTNKKGFTITELVIVIAVIAILAAVLIPTFSHVVENAKQSAALQTCKNALTEYSAVVGADDNTENDDMSGMVFVSDGYAYVFLNSKLNFIGNIKDLENVNQSGAIDHAKAKTNAISGTGTTNAKITLGTDTKDVKLADLAKSEVKDKEHADELLYTYTVELNTTTYRGYFTYEVTGAKYQVEAATYSRMCGFVVGNFSIVIS